jgi:hypothetical protein
VRIIAHTASGKANKATIEVLAGFFGVKKRAVRIIKGKKSREKIIDVSLRYALVGNITEDKRLQKILKNPRKHRKTSQKYIKNVMERGVNQNLPLLPNRNFHLLNCSPLSHRSNCPWDYQTFKERQQ